jgi:hypothetical protein
MKLVKINETVFIDPTEVCSIEKNTVEHSNSPSGSDSWFSWTGSVVTLKNGRKIYVKDLSPDTIFELLKPDPKIQYMKSLINKERR